LFDAQVEAIALVNEALRPMGKRLWRTSETDGLRLTRLLVWAERYNVSLTYVLETILPVLSKAIERRTGRRQKSGLGCTIPVLTGEVAKSILLERIAKDFPGGENVNTRIEERKQEMLLKIDEDIEGGKPKSPLAYESAQNATSAYKKGIKRRRRRRTKLEEQIAAMPFRGNPFN